MRCLIPVFNIAEKKSLHWQSSFGTIRVEEPLLRKGTVQIRPFCESSGVKPRGYSRPLQRIIVDFGADHAFGRVEQKLKEHYGLVLPPSSLRHITLKHSQHMLAQQQLIPEVPETKVCDQLIVETDGSFIPIMTPDDDSKDKRKHKVLHWQEAKLSLAHPEGSATLKFGVSFQHGPSAAGQQLLRCAVLAGLDRKTSVHGVGDGAVWIINQMDEQFGSQGHYLIDFYHACEYLAAAAPACTQGEITDWIEQQKQRLKQAELAAVLQELKVNLEPNAIDDKEAPVRNAHRYLSNRPDQLNYQQAIANNLPIGSGEIESAHRYVIQERLKLPGAWWKAANAESMMALRVERANGTWESYWQKKQLRAAA